MKHHTTYNTHEHNNQTLIIANFVKSRTKTDSDLTMNSRAQ